MKFVVGILLTSFRIFWGAEGAGAVWPGADAALLVIVPAVAVFALALVALLSPPGAVSAGCRNIMDRRGCATGASDVWSSAARLSRLTASMGCRLRVRWRGQRQDYPG